jgi:hypothetical protein
MRTVAGLLLAASLLTAQEYRKHNIFVLGGAGIPGGELKEFTSVSPGLGVGYGYRFLEYFQAEAGYELLFGAARVRDFLPTFYGNLRIRDYQHFLPYGGRVIVPIDGDRIQLFAGGGGIYMRYSERVRQPFAQQGLTFDCDVCAARDGTGYYGLVGGNVALDRSQLFRVGVTARFVRGETSGEPIGSVPARTTEDRWTNIFFTFGIQF